MTTADQKKTGTVQFYGRRQGHPLRPGRRQLMDTVFPGLKIELPRDGGLLDIDRIFGTKKREYWLEIGFGSGEHLAAMAQKFPDFGFMGCEPFINGVAALVSVIDKNNLGNVRIFNDDAHLLLPHLPTDALHRIYLPYADPWPKKKHHHRRMVQAGTVRTFARLLKNGGEFQFASDHMGYVRWVLETMSSQSDFAWTARVPEDWRTRPADSIETRYEAKARSKGSPCVYLHYCRLPRPR